MNTTCCSVMYPYLSDYSLKSFTKRLPFMNGHYEKYKTLKRVGEDTIISALLVKYNFLGIFSMVMTYS